MQVAWLSLALAILSFMRKFRRKGLSCGLIIQIWGVGVCWEMQLIEVLGMFSSLDLRKSVRGD